METLRAIRTRRTIRRYKTRDIPMKILFEVLDCARWAPTYMNAQSWEFVIIKKESEKTELARITGEGWIGSAPVVVAVLANLDRARFFIKDNAEKIALFECAAAAENMLLAARDRGLGSAVILNFDRKQIAKLLEAPESVVPVALVTLGYQAEYPDSERDPLSHFIHVEKFGNPWPEKLPLKYEKKEVSSEFVRLLG